MENQYRYSEGRLYIHATNVGARTPPLGSGTLRPGQFQASLLAMYIHPHTHSTYVRICTFICPAVPRAAPITSRRPGPPDSFEKPQPNRPSSGKKKKKIITRSGMDHLMWKFMLRKKNCAMINYWGGGIYTSYICICWLTYWLYKKNFLLRRAGHVGRLRPSGAELHSVSVHQQKKEARLLRT